LSRDDQIFSDSVGAITVTGSVVRIDFVALSPTERDPSGSPKMEFTHRVVMPIEGFVRSVAKLQETLQALVSRGVLRPGASASASSLMPDNAPAGVPDDAPNNETPPVPPKPKLVPFP